MSRRAGRIVLAGVLLTPAFVGAQALERELASAAVVKATKRSALSFPSAQMPSASCAPARNRMTPRTGSGNALKKSDTESANSNPPARSRIPIRIGAAPVRAPNCT